MESQNQNNQQILDRIEKLQFIVNGLENNGPFNDFVKIFEEQALMADATWQNCIVESEKGRNLFYELRSNKRSIINIINKLDELRGELQMLQDELTELQSE